MCDFGIVRKPILAPLRKLRGRSVRKEFVKKRQGDA
jgi:hypothetical protein